MNGAVVTTLSLAATQTLDQAAVQALSSYTLPAAQYLDLALVTGQHLLIVVGSE